MGGRKKDSLDSIQKILTKKGIRITLSGEYINQKSKITCVCDDCGYCWETLSSTLKKWKGESCRYCSLGWIRSTDELREKIRKQGKDFSIKDSDTKYSYSVTCNICSYAWNSTRTGLLTNNCARCSGKEKGSLLKVQKLVKERGIQVTGEYVNAFTKLNCHCLKCKENWEATPHNLTKSLSGCPFCCFKGRIPRGREATLYYVRIDSNLGCFWKIGITTKKEVLDRFASDKYKITVLYSHVFEDGEQAYISEKNILRLYKEYLVENVKILRDGNTEIFTHDVLQMNHLDRREYHDRT